jgi:hypothetical protein
MTESAASASVFALSFLPVRGKKLTRGSTIKLAEQVGPLCPDCLKKRNDLAVESPSATHPELNREELKNLRPELLQVLESELLAGNQIERVDALSRVTGAIFVLLALPFHSTPERPPLRYARLEDRKRWKAHYVHLPTAQIVACGFGGE